MMEKKGIAQKVFIEFGRVNSMVVGIVLGAAMLFVGLYLIVLGPGLWPWFGLCLGVAGALTWTMAVLDEP